MSQMCTTVVDASHALISCVCTHDEKGGKDPLESNFILSGTTVLNLSMPAAAQIENYGCSHPSPLDIDYVRDYVLEFLLPPGSPLHAGPCH